jgi:hypothetical protein
MAIKVIGAGFGRTGTASLKAALEQLGFDKCYHMIEVFQNPAHAQVWIDASQGRPVDWDALFKGYQATVDWPGAAFYQELMRRYPDAKVLLSVRDPERWYRSALDTIYGAARPSHRSWLARLIPMFGRMNRLLEGIVWKGTFQGRFEDKQYAIDIFNQHNEEVTRVVPPERLLVYDIKEGWEPLCRFLGVPVPKDMPFPHLNDTAAFQKMISLRNRTMQVALASVLALAALLAGWLTLRARRLR